MINRSNQTLVLPTPRCEGWGKAEICNLCLGSGLQGTFSSLILLHTLDNVYFKLSMPFDHRSQEHVRSLPFLKGTLDMEALILLRQQTSGQTDAIHNKWSPGEGITNDDWE